MTFSSGNVLHVVVSCAESWAESSPCYPGNTCWSPFSVWAGAGTVRAEHTDAQLMQLEMRRNPASTRPLFIKRRPGAELFYIFTYWPSFIAPFPRLPTPGCSNWAIEKCQLDVMHSERGSSSHHKRPCLVDRRVLCSRYMYVSTEPRSRLY